MILVKVNLNKLDVWIHMSPSPPLLPSINEYIYIYIYNIDDSCESKLKQIERVGHMDLYVKIGRASCRERVSPRV